MSKRTVIGADDRDRSDAQLFERVLSLAEAGAASHRFASDAGADAGSTVLAALLEDRDADRSDKAIAKMIAAALSRDRYATQSALALVTATAERSDRSPALAWEPLTVGARRAAAASLTAGNVETMTDEKVDAILAAHSGVADVPARTVGATVLRNARRALVGLAAMTDALRAAVAPWSSEPTVDQRVDAETETPTETPTVSVRRTSGARWSTVSTAGAAYRENGTDETGATRYGIDAGSIVGIRHRDSDAGVGAETLRDVHSAESALLRDAGASALRSAFTAPFSPEHSGRGRPSSAQRHAWETVEHYATSIDRPAWSVIAEHATDAQYTRTGRRISGARVRWSALAETVGLSTDETSTRALARVVDAWARNVERVAWDAQRPTDQGDGRRSLPNYASPARVLYACSTDESETVSTFLAWDAARRLFVSVGAPERVTRRLGSGRYRSTVSRLARGTAGDRQRALSTLADIFRDDADRARVLALVDRGVSVSSLSPSPACRIGQARGMTDPRYMPETDAETVETPDAWRYIRVAPETVALVPAGDRIDPRGLVIRRAAAIRRLRG